MTAEPLAAMLRTDDTDLYLSRVVRVEGQDVGLVLLGRRGSTVRVAAMGLVPAARGRRLGGAALEQLLPVLREARVRDAAARGDRRERRLRCGCTSGSASRPTAGSWASPAGTPTRRPARRGGEIDPADAVAFLAAHGEPAPALAAAAAVAVGPRLADARVRARRARASRWRCRRRRRRAAGGLRATPPSGARASAGSSLAGVAAALEPGGWNVPPIVPEGLADGFLQALGFEQARIWQHEMTLAL